MFGNIVYIPGKMTTVEHRYRTKVPRKGTGVHNYQGPSKEHRYVGT